jgi:hypothetical protein
MNSTTPPTLTLPTLLRRSSLLFASPLIAWFVLLPKAQAVTPPPDGGYLNRTTAEGQNALFNLTSGTDNTAVGFSALWNDTTGSYNTATGEQTLYLNVGGIYNTATGYRALYSNTGSKNTADGFRALFSNTTGRENTASGFQALYSNISGIDNVAVGSDALYNNTNGFTNTAIGFQALFSNTSGSENTAVGLFALYANTTGQLNTAVGDGALGLNKGNANTAIGSQALGLNTGGFDNTAIGFQALFGNTSGIKNTAIGIGALGSNTSGSGNIALGNIAGANVRVANNVICIGAPGADVDDSCFIGNIRDVTTQNGDAIPVVIDSAGQLGTLSSSRRFKKEITPMEKASEAILSLKPVMFHYKSDKTSRAQFGLIAEEVAKVNPDLVVRDRNGEIYTVRYDAVNAMLLNEFLKEHKAFVEEQRKVERLTKDFESEIAEQQKQIEALSAGLQKVSAQLAAASPSRRTAGGHEANKPTPQIVLNSQ